MPKLFFFVNVIIFMIIYFKLLKLHECREYFCLSYLINFSRVKLLILIRFKNEFILTLQSFRRQVSFIMMLNVDI